MARVRWISESRTKASAGIGSFKRYRFLVCHLPSYLRSGEGPAAFIAGLPQRDNSRTLAGHGYGKESDPSAGRDGKSLASFCPGTSLHWRDGFLSQKLSYYMCDFISL